MAGDLIKRERIRGTASLGRRDLVIEAAIAVLAQHGARGLSHRRVDRHLDWPLGSTGNFFPRRDEILIAIAQRIVQLDAEDLALDRVSVKRGGPGQDQFAARLVRLTEKWLRPAYRDRLMAGAEVLMESRRNPNVRRAVQAQLSINENGYRRIFEQLGSDDPVASAKLFSFSISSFYMGTCIATHIPNKKQLRELVSGWITCSLVQTPERANDDGEAEAEATSVVPFATPTASPPRRRVTRTEN